MHNQKTKMDILWSNVSKAGIVAGPSRDRSYTLPVRLYRTIERRARIQFCILEHASWALIRCPACKLTRRPTAGWACGCWPRLPFARRRRMPADKNIASTTSRLMASMRRTCSVVQVHQWRGLTWGGRLGVEAWWSLGEPGKGPSQLRRSRAPWHGLVAFLSARSVDAPRWNGQGCVQ